MTTTTTERAAEIVTEIRKHGGCPYVWEVYGRLGIKVLNSSHVPTALLLEASMPEIKQRIIAGLLDFAARGYEP